MMQVDKRDDKKRIKAATQVGVGWVGWWWGLSSGAMQVEKDIVITAHSYEA